MFYSAEDAPQLRRVFADLPKDVTVQKEPREVTASLLYTAEAKLLPVAS